MSRALKLALVAMVAALFMVGPAMALPGDLDPSFHGNGLLEFNYPTSTFHAYAPMAMQSTGKILMATGVDTPTLHSVIVKRFNFDGTVDGTFGSGGEVVIDFDGTTVLTHGDFPQSVRVLAGDKILVTGFTGGGSQLAGVARLDASGGFDTSFSADGILTFSPTYFGIDGYVDASGRTVVFSSNMINFQVARFDGSGNADSSFDGGISFFKKFDPNGKSTALGSEMFEQPDGKTIIVGTAKLASGAVAMSAYRLNGSAEDITYDGDGLVQGPAGSVGYGSVLQPDGKLVIAGLQSDGSTQSTALMRVDQNGQPDPTFGVNGYVTHVFGKSSSIQSVSVDAQGRLIAFGTLQLDTDYLAAAWRFKPDGSVDTTFGDGGQRIVPFAGNNLTPDDTLVQSDGSYLVSATNSTPGTGQTFMARLRGGSVPPVRATFNFKITSPKGKTLKAKKLKKFSGVTTSNYPIAKTEIALQRIDKKLLKKRKKCSWLSGSKPKFKSIKAVKKKCDAPRWLTAKGTADWSYKLKKPLKKGRYVLFIRSTAGTGEASVPSKSAGTVRQFRLK